MKILRLSAVLLALPLLAEGPPLPPLEACLPADAAAVLVVRDMPRLVAAWNRTHLPGLLGQAKGMLDQMGQGMEDAEVMDLLEALQPALKGQLALGVTGSEEIGNQIRSLYGAPSEKTPVNVLLLAEVVPEAFEVLEGLVLKRLSGKAELTRERCEGGTLRILKEKGKSLSVTWTLASGHLALAFGDEPLEVLKSAVEALKRGKAEPSAADNPRFQEAARRVGAFQALLFLDLEALASRASKALTEVEALPEAGRDQDIPSPAALSKVLALNSLRSGYAALSSRAGGADLDLGLLYAQPEGFLRLLALSPGPCPRPDFLPMDAVWLGANRLSLAELLAAAEGIAEDLGPQALGEFQMGLAFFQTEMGIGPKALLASLGDETAWAGFPRKDPKQFLPYGMLQAVSVKDPAVLGRSLDVIREKMIQGMAQQAEAMKEMGMPAGDKPPYTRRDVLGATVHSFVQDSGMGMSLETHYVLAGRWLLVCIGEPAPLDAALRRILKPEASPWERPEVKADLQALPDTGAGSLGWGNPAASLLGNYVMGMMFACQGVMAQMGGGGPAMPAPEEMAGNFGRAVTSSTQEPGGYAVRVRWFPPKAVVKAP